MYQDRIKKAEELFLQGYNCAQSVTAAFADIYGIDFETALKISAGFGAGIGRMRETCGAACGMFILAGLEKGSLVGGDQKQKGDCYKLVQELAEKYKKNNGSLICAEILGIKKPTGDEYNPVPEKRTEDYFKKRPCVQKVKNAAEIYVEYLINNTYN